MLTTGLFTTRMFPIVVDAAKGPCQLGTVEIQLWPSRTKERGFALQIKGVA